MPHADKTIAQLEAECRQTTEELGRIKQEFGLLVDTIPAMVFKGYADWSVDFHSNRVEEITGYAKAEFDARRLTWLQVMLQEDHDRARTIFLQALKTNRSYVREYRIRRKDGQILWIEERSHIVCDPSARIDHVTGLFFDVTDRVLTEESCLKYRETLQQMLMKCTGDLKRANERLRQAGLLTKQPAAGGLAAPSPVTLATEPEPQVILLARLHLVECAASHTLEGLLRATLDEVEAMTGSQIGFFHFLEADQKTLSLQTWSTRTLREMCQAEGSGLHYDVSRAGVWVDCIHARRPVIHNDYATLPHRKGMPSGHAQVVRELVVPVLRGNRIVAILGVGNKPRDYTEKDVATISTLADLAWDLVERKRAEESVRKSEERFRCLAENSPVGINIIQDDHLVYVNPELKRMTDGALEEGGLLRFDRVHSDDVDEVQRLYDQLKHGEIQCAEVTFRFCPQHLAGTEPAVKWLHCRASVIEYLGRPGIIMNLIDITRQKEMEHLLRMEDKMACLGRMTAGLAHELRNPVSGITIHLTNLERACDDLEIGDPEAFGKIREIIAELKAAGERVETVVRRVMDFARPGVPHVVATSINQSIEEALQLSWPSLHRCGIRIEQDLAADLPQCCIDSQLIDRVLINLITNSMQVMERGAEPKVIALRSFAEGAHVVIKVSDSGPGVPQHLRDRIFDPFFTTQNSGLGIGLSLCQRIITDHGGTLEVCSSRWGGAEFTIRIPIDKGSAGSG